MSDIQHTIIENYLPKELFNKYYKEYPVDWIKEYCSDPTVSEHDSSLYGNYSAPTELYDPDLIEWVKQQLPDIKLNAVGREVTHDHFYTNFHYDERGSWIEEHNDLKDMRWLVTNQIYMCNNQGARLLDRELNVTAEVPCVPNTFYNIVADPWSWHDVPEVSNHKRSILFRVGKRRSNSIAHPDDGDDTAYIIYNNFQKDRHYAKLGLRMGNLTEAHLHSLGAKNIMHTAWRSEESLHRNIKKALQRYKRVVIVLSGYLLPSLTIADNTALQTLTDANTPVNLDENVEIAEYFRITDDNIDAYADCVFSDLSGDHVLAEAEQVMYTYYQNKLHLNYIDL